MGKCAYDVNLSDIHRDLINIAKEAGKTIVTATPPPSSSATGTKKNSADLVTETDQAVEKQISKYLCTKYPSFEFLGEETYKPGMKLTDAPTFVVDPIDGTTNFVHGHPYVSVSLGFAVCREPQVGVVFCPFSGIMYTAIAGEGSYRKELELNEEGDWVIRKGREPVKLPLKEATPLEGLGGTLVAVEWGSDRVGKNWECLIKTWDNLGRAKEEGGAMVHSARCLGSAALNFCAVAEGTIDSYWEGGCWAWDVCAGWVVLSEAGGIVVDGNPGRWKIPVDHRKYLAVRGAPSGQKELIEEFWSHVAGTMDYES